MPSLYARYQQRAPRQAAGGWAAAGWPAIGRSWGEHATTSAHIRIKAPRLAFTHLATSWLTTGILVRSG